QLLNLYTTSLSLMGVSGASWDAQHCCTTAPCQEANLQRESSLVPVKRAAVSQMLTLGTAHITDRRNQYQRKVHRTQAHPVYVLYRLQTTAHYQSLSLLPARHAPV